MVKVIFGVVAEGRYYITVDLRLYDGRANLSRVNDDQEIQADFDTDEVKVVGEPFNDEQSAITSLESMLRRVSKIYGDEYLLPQLR